jgi:hypothetical protein
VISARKRRSLQRFSSSIWVLRLFIAAIFAFAASSECAGQQDAAAAESAKADKLTHFGIVIDNSGTSRLALERSVKLAASFVSSDTGASEGFLVTYADREKITLRQELTSDKLELRDAIENIYAESGGGALLDAVKLAADHLRTAAGEDNPGFLLIVTSGEDRSSNTKIEDLVKQLKASKIRLYIVGLSDGKVESKHIDRLVKETGGKKYLPLAGDDLSGLLETLLSDINR